MTGSERALGGTVTFSDITVPRMGYGAMQLTGPGIWGDFRDRDEGVAILRRAYELGARLFDTADAYGPETNESLIADALGDLDDALVATKGGITRPGPGVWERNGRPERLRQACEGSLKRLRRDHIDLYQLHGPDKNVPYEDSIGALAELQGEGKIRHIGVSNVNIEQLRKARSVVDVVSVQNRYNLDDRHCEDVLKICTDENIVFLPWYPIASGRLASRGGVVDDVARRRNATPVQVSLAWLLYRSPAVALIPGTSSMEHLEENFASAEVELTDEDLAELQSA